MRRAVAGKVLEYSAQNPSIGFGHSPSMTPSFPIGSCIDSMLTAVHRLSPVSRLQSSRKRFYGTRPGDGANAIGRHAQVLSENAFKGRISAHKLILEHSAWPVFSRLLPTVVAQKWFAQCVAGEIQSAKQRFHSPTRGSLFANSWRSCVDCIASDRGRCGTGHWRVVHQLPGVNHCPTHGSPLLVCCADCGSPIGNTRLDALPGEPCSACGCAEHRSAVEEPRTNGLAALGSLYEVLLAGDGPNLDPFSRHELQRHEIAQRSGGSIDAYIKGFFAFYECEDAEALTRILAVEVTTPSLRATLNGGVNVCSPIVQLALAAYALQAQACDLGDVLWATSAAHEDGIELPARTDEDASIERLLDAGREAGFSVTAIRLTLSGKTPKELEAKRICTVKTWDRFCNELSPELRLLLPETKLSSPRPLELRLPRNGSLEQKTAVHRARLLAKCATGEPTREVLTQLCRNSYQWCLTHDRVWLDKAFPRRSPTKGGRPRSTN